VLAGGVSGMASLLVCHPMDTIRVKVTTLSMPPHASPWRTLQHTVRTEGVARGLYKGMAAPLLAQGVYKAVLFSSFNNARRWFFDDDEDSKKPLSFAQTVACGCFAGGVNSFVVTPVELVRNNRMVQGHQSVALKEGPLAICRRIYRSGGVLGFWRGIASTLCRDVPGCGAWYLGYNVATMQMQQRWNKNSDKPLAMWQTLLCGSVAGVSFWTVALPMDTIKSRIQTSSKAQSASIASLLRDLYRGGRGGSGVASLYQGGTVAFTRGSPGSAITFWTYQHVMQLLKEQQQQEEEAEEDGAM
jgi:solute carrier family 25 carnitine/acylcarnitine transporter 20/29